MTTSQTGDGLAQAAVKEQYPDLDRVLKAPQTRAAILRYLGSEEPWQDSAAGFTMNALGFLQSDASAKEATVIRPTAPPCSGYVTKGYGSDGQYYQPRDNASMVNLCQRC